MNVTEALADRIRKADDKYGAPYSSHESLGVITEEYHELVEAVRCNASSSIAEEALDIAAACIRLAEACAGPFLVFQQRSGFVR